MPVPVNIPFRVKLPTGPGQPRVPSNHEMPKIQVPYIPPQRIPSQLRMPKEPIISIPPQRKSPVEPPNVRFEDANVRFETSK